MNDSKRRPLRSGATLLSALLILGAGVLTGCQNSGGLISNPPDGTNTPGGNDDGNNDGSDDGGTNNEPLSSDGSVSGRIATSQTTRAAGNDTSSAQTVPDTFDPNNTCVRLKDMAGNDLLDPNGEPMPEIEIQPDGSFTADNLPVGQDFTICGDIGKDGICDIESCVQIPAGEDGIQGELDDVQADPLTTLILAKLRQIANARGLDARNLPISPAALVARIVDAYTNLFEESGVDQILTVDDLEAFTPEQWADLFDAVVPQIAQSAMKAAEGNLDLATAEDVEAIAAGAAVVFLQAGFPIADHDNDVDLSFLADIAGVETSTLAEILQKSAPFEDNLEPIQDELPPNLEPAEVDPFNEVTVYINTLAEPDRNFVGEDDSQIEGVPHLPIMHDFMLFEMARLQHENRTITLGDLHNLLVDMNDGLGVRLMYFLHDPNFFGPPLSVFESVDGKGIAVSLEELFSVVFTPDFLEVDPEQFSAKEDELRTILLDRLGDSIPPQFGRIFGAVASDRVQGIGELSAKVRDARVHLPFSRSGPSEFFVVADGDPFRSGVEVNPISVNAEVTINGEVLSVQFDPTGNGTYYLSFTHQTDQEGVVELLVRETGRIFHGARGPVRLNMNDGDIFEPIGGEPFIDYVSEQGSFYHGVEVSVIADDFAPDNSNLEPADAGFQGPNDLIFVLATGPGGDPVRVSYDMSTGIATYNPGGRHVLMFTPESEQTGEFILFNEDTGRPAGTEDPSGFFDAPPDKPEGFEDFFNLTDEYPDLDDYEDYFPPDGEFPDDGIIDDGFTDDGFIPPDDDMPPPDGEEPPPEGDMPPPDEQTPPPDDGVNDPPVEDDGGDTPVDPAAEDDGTDETSTDDGSLEEPPLDEPGTDGDVPPDEFPTEDMPTGVPPGVILVSVENIQGFTLGKEEFTHVFGTDVPNPRYDSSGDPFYDDIDGNDVHDVNEPTAQFRPLLFNAADWRSTDIRLYYRRADNNQSVLFENVDFESDTPMTQDGVALVPRSYKPRLNAFRFGRPNTAINLLTAFLPPSFFNGTQSLDASTTVDMFSALAIINLVMDQKFNVEADIDPDGFGPLPKAHTTVDADLFVAPIGDPFVLLIDGFELRSTPGDE